jgi:hypothetical protein
MKKKKKKYTSRGRDKVRCCKKKDASRILKVYIPYGIA